ncbi:MAG: hypothetical protein ACE15B_00005 [Bryobacteraceae bacterium]
MTVSLLIGAGTGPPAGIETEPDREVRWWRLPQLDWPAGDRLMRVVKTVRIEVALAPNTS